MPSIQDVAWITSPQHPWRRSSRDTEAVDGDLVAFEAEVMVDGYSGGLGRTVIVGDMSNAAADLLHRRDRLWWRLFEACRPGAPVSGVLAAYELEGLPAPPMPVVHGLGLGFDEPVVLASLPRSAAAARFEEGVVVAVTAFVWQQGVGAAFGQEPVVITASGADMLSASPFAV